MALNSVNTNTGAMIALQNLNTTNFELMQVQGRVNTGQSGPGMALPIAGAYGLE